MENSKLIHNYLDGGLGEVEQDILFKNLADDQELRHEFNQQMKIHSISKNDMASIQPPMEATEHIFSELGFQIPSDSKKRPLAAPVSTANNRSGYLTAGLLLITLGIATIIFGTDYFSSPSPEFAQSSQTELAQSIPVVSQAIVSSETTTDDNQNPIVTNQRNDAYESINTESTPLNNANYALSESDELSASEEAQEAESFILFESEISPYESAIIAIPTSKFGRENNPVSLSEIIESGDFLITMRNSQPNSFTPNSVDGQEGTNFNWGASINYRAAFLDENLWLGLSGGREQFSQNYTTIRNGREFNESQSPFLYYGGLNLRYDLKDFAIMEDELYPVAEMLMGANSMGPMVRTQLGMNWRPIGRLNVNLGVEMNQSWFRNAGQTFNSGNYGLYYGIGYSF
jgi:hypothetical protein